MQAVIVGYCTRKELKQTMAKTPNLVIVESPAKAKTIVGILGKNYKVLSSYGHIRDLSKNSMGIDIENDFKPDYIISDDKKKLVSELRKEAQQADMVWLASDEDREGEAIAWHLYEVLDRKGKPTKRIAFHEITPSAIAHAIENPRDIDKNLVDAQQARRVLDRIVGFELSPILWRRIKPSLSAGRVQSVALRLICDREESIKSFETTSSYKVVAIVASNNTANKSFEAQAEELFSDANQAKAFIERNAKGALLVTSIEGKPAQRTPAPPFTTSSLQQEASRKLGFSVSRTMSIAQKLYESGHITYMRTDSTNLSTLALNNAEKVIKDLWGEKYHKRRNYHTTSKGAQEAHEAIRPTYIDRETIKGDAATVKLYQLIRMRTLASQMAEALFERTTVKIENQQTNDRFTAQGEVMLFDGFLKAYTDDAISSANEKQLPPLKPQESLHTKQYIATEHFTYPPARYTEATLVRNMEELGIGRPSTYAPTIQTLFQREYIKLGNSLGKERTYHDFVLDLEAGIDKIVEQKRKEKTGSNKGKLLPTDIGIVVNNFLVEHFKNIVDYNFTADIEEQFDSIARGEKPWTSLMHQFYNLFHPFVDEAMETRDSSSRGERELGVDPKTGNKVIVRIGRYGPVVQIGDTENPDEKPKFASIPPTLSMLNITLEEALNLMKLPRVLGTFEGKELRTNEGRFGAYVQLGDFFASLPKNLTPLTITFNEAVDLILEKRQKEAQSILRTYSEDESLTIREGRWGPYIKQGKNNYKLDKKLHEKASELTYEEVNNIIEQQSKNDHSPKRTKGVTSKKGANSAKGKANSTRKKE